MELTNELVRRFTGWQMEVKADGREHYLYRGQIKTIAIESGVLRVMFAWLAKRLGGRWVNDTGVDYRVDVENIFAHEFRELSEGRFYYHQMFTDEGVTLFPPNYPSNLERNQVDGL